MRAAINGKNVPMSYYEDVFELMRSKELSDTPKTDDGKEIENLEENNDKSKSEEKD